MNRLTAGAALLAGWLLAAVLAAAPAAAHSMLEESTPAHGTRLATAPEYVALHFSEQVGIDPGHLRVVDADGRRVDRGEAHYAHGRTDHVRVELRPGLGEGSYLASWRVVSADSHPISGTFAFVVGDGPLLAGPAGAGDGTDGTTAALVTATRAVTFGGVVLLGGAVFLALCWPAGWARPAARRVVAAGWLAVTAATLAALALQGPYAAGTGPGDLLSADLLGATADSTFGRLHLARLGALAVLVGGAETRRRLRYRDEGPLAAARRARET